MAVLAEATTLTAPADRDGTRTVLPGQAPEGIYILSVLLKRTYDIVANGTCMRAEEDHPINAGDVYWDHPMNSSVRFESDFIPYKVATDVVLNGTAYAPGGVPTPSCTASLQVGDRRKSIAVIGDRVAHYAGGGPPAITDPVPFTTMPIRYEYAYGGIDVFSDLKVPYPYPRNRVGRGFVVANSARSVKDLPMPNLEDPNALLDAASLCLGEFAQWETRPMPVGFGWFSKVSYPRALLAGVMPLDRAVEQEMRKAYAALVPADQREAYMNNGFRDIDFRFFNGASEGGAFPFLTGGETIATENLCPEGQLSFRLPGETPRIGLDIGAGIQEPEVVLHTVMIHMDERQVDLTWRAAVPYAGPDWLPQMRKMEVSVA